MSSKPNVRRKPSKAAMGRRLAEVVAQREQHRELPAALAVLVDTYTSPTLSDTQLATIRPFLRTVITASNIEGAESGRKHCTHLANLAAYALARGLLLEPATVLTTALIDEYVRLGMGEAKETLRAERRRRLLALAATVNPGPTTPAKLPPIGHATIKPPYTPAELAVIARVSRTQPTEAKRRALSAVVSLGAGAGCDSVDMRDLFIRHIEDLGDDGLQVHVQGPRPRVVPVRATLEDLLRSAIAGRRCDDLVLGVKRDRRNTAARAVEAAALYKVPHIEPSRLRATWLADVMTDTIPIGLILQAAGLKSARTLAELLPQLEPWLAHKNLPIPATDALRGGTR